MILGRKQLFYFVKNNVNHGSVFIHALVTVNNENLN